jgi:uncharacterized OB-fold protein
MGFERFGVLSFAAETLASDFVTYLDEGKVMATRCKKCGGVFFPPRMQCTSCFSTDVEWFDVGEGKLVTYTIVQYGPLGFENDTPYTLALVEFPSGVKVFGRLDKAIAEGDIKVGMALKPYPVKLPEDRISYEFKKI